MDPLVFAALRHATRAHDGQWRKGGNCKKAPPYVVHCLEVAEMVSVQGGNTCAQTIAIALLHDTIEDTYTTYDDLHAEFGLYVADGVRLLSIPPDVSDDPHYQVAKHEFQMQSLERMDRNVRMVKFADKTCNVRALVRYKPVWKEAAIHEYARKAKELCDAIRNDLVLSDDLLRLHDDVFSDFEATYSYL